MRFIALLILSSLVSHAGLTPRGTLTPVGPGGTGLSSITFRMMRP